MAAKTTVKRRKASSLSLFEFDREYCGAREIAGADEAGRGCLAGPIVVAAVVFDYSLKEPRDYSSLMSKLTDSKKLKAPVREELYPLITRYASRFSIVVAGNRTIDRKGLHVTNLRSLCQSVESLEPWPDIVLIDGRQQLPECAVEHLPVTGGDSLSACIAAASVLAKVTRDRLMHRFDALYPEYGFGNHVGYGTREHRDAISVHGLSPLHRRSFSMGITPGEGAAPDAGSPDGALE